MRLTHYFACITLVLHRMTVAPGSFAQRGLRNQMDNTLELMAALTDTLITKLTLTEDQISVVRAILKIRAESLLALRPEPSRGREQLQSIRAK